MTRTPTTTAQRLRIATLALSTAGLMAGCATNAEPTSGASTKSTATTSTDPGFATHSAALTGTLPAPLTVAPLACSQPLPPGITAPRGLWAWTATIATNPTERAKFLQFADARGVRSVYMTGPEALSAGTATLGSFTAEAAKHCMQVELLFGRMEWALTANHGAALAQAQQAVTAAAQLPVGSRPVGVQFDIEPYTLPQWSTNMNSVANQYLDLLEKLAPVVHAGGLRLTMAVPFWFDTKMVTRGGVTRPMSELVADRVDRVALMDYRDDAASMVAMAQNEVNYASKIGRDVIVGAETMCGLAPQTVTFCEEGRAKLDAALTAVATGFIGQTGFAGVAVHHYGSYLQLK
jgi:hypothetical protein